MEHVQIISVADPTIFGRITTSGSGFGSGSGSGSLEIKIAIFDS
jgi:hypothetical protein